MTSESVRFGDRLRGYREAAGYSQEELAERAGLSANAISALERGERKRPYPDTLRRLAEALGLSDDERTELAATLRAREEAIPAPEPASPQHTLTELPGEPTPLIGREQEVEVVRHLLDHAAGRLLTLIGPGGVGKTRLALHVARSASHRYRDGVAWVPLAPLDDASLVLPTLARALGLEESLSASPTDTLRRHLREREMLLVVDNLEHVLDAAPELAELLYACPGISMLATSRAPLNIRGEQEYAVPPLELPPAGPVQGMATVAGIPSVTLFVWQAQQRNPAFALTDDNATAVTAICRRLDGVPLALELAAARVRTLTPDELLARLDLLIPFLVGGSRDLPKRQQTMRAAISWSYDLLGSAEQALFRRLSVFAGGWTMDAAEAVAAWGVVKPTEVVELLSRLVEHSLVVARASADATSRYWMLEPIRQFAAHCVEDEGETAQLKAHHLAWCHEFTRSAERELIGPDQQRWLDRLEMEHDNLRTALAWSQADARTATDGLQLATALWRFWATRGHLAEGRRWLESAIAAARDAPADLLGKALNAAGNLAIDQGDYAQATALIEASLDHRRAVVDDAGMASSLNDLGNIMLYEGHHRRARDLYAEAMSHYRDAGMEWGVAIAMQNMGIVEGLLGAYERAAMLLYEALGLWTRLGNTAARARTLDALAVVMRDHGDPARAETLHEQSLELRRALGDTRGISVTLKNYGVALRDKGDYEQATLLIEESLRLRRSIGDKMGAAGSLSALAEVVRRVGDTERAERLFREAIAARKQIGVTDGVADCLLGLAAIAGVRGNPARAARLLGASEALRETTQHVIHLADRAEYERIAAAIEASMPPAELALARSAGHAMTLDEIIAAEVEGQAIA